MRRSDLKKDSIAVFPITEKGWRLAGLAKALGDIVIYTPAELKNGGLRKKVKAAFSRHKALFFISATGIAVRSIAPLLKSKDKDPAVVVMDDCGTFAVSLVSGHLGGANKLAKRVSGIYGATPVITTATDVAGLACVEDIAEAFSLKIEDVKKIKRVNSAILKNEKVLFVDGDKKRCDALKKRFPRDNFRFAKRPPVKAERFGAVVMITPSTADLKVMENAMILRPPELVVGVGCRRGAGVKEIKKAIADALEKAKLSERSIRNLATIDIKKDEAGLLRYAESSQLKIEFFNAAELDRIKPPSPSKRVKEATGTWGVCESAAMLSAKTRKIWLKKQKTEKVTVALARAGFTS